MQTDKLVIAMSSRALFDLEAGHQVFIEQGVEAYAQYQIDHEEDVLQPGVAFHLAQKLLALNLALNNDAVEDKSDHPKVEILLLSRNSADTGLRVFNSIEHHGLNIARAAFTSGQSPFRYVSSFGAHLFLSAEPEDVQATLNAGFAAATIIPAIADLPSSNELRIAFDGDAVLFSDEAERIYQERGLQAFTDSEKAAAKSPLPGGPFKSFLSALHRIQAEYTPDNCPIRTALVTARSAPAHERVIRTLREWNIRIDEALFLGGLPKGAFLREFGADIFFDDQPQHIESAADEQVATGHVPHGVTNTIR